MDEVKPKIILYFVALAIGYFQVYIKFIPARNPIQTYDVYILDKGRVYSSRANARKFAEKYIQSLPRKMKKEYDISIDEEVRLKYPNQKIEEEKCQKN